MKTLLPVLLCLGLVGCAANPGIVRLSPDTYVLYRESHAGIFLNAARMKADVIREADEFAEKQGKVAIPIAAKETPMRPGMNGQYGAFEYQFRVVDKNDPEARRASLVPRPDLVIDKTEKVSADISSKDITEKKPDLYTELMKLDDLRKKGILTEDEFQAQKKLLLEKQQ
jgi:hypothetical protein